MPTSQTLLHDTEQTLSTLLQPKLSCKYKLLTFQRLVLNVNNLLTTSVQDNDQDFLIQNKETIYKFYTAIIAHSNSTIRLLSGTEESIKEIEKIILGKALFVITPSALSAESSFSSCYTFAGPFMSKEHKESGSFSTLQEHIEFLKRNMHFFGCATEDFTEIKPRINLVLKFFELILSQPNSISSSDKQSLIRLWQKFVEIIVPNLSNLNLLSTTLYWWSDEGDTLNTEDFAKKVIREIIKINYIILGLEKEVDLSDICNSLSQSLSHSLAWLPEGLNFIDIPIDGHCLYNAVALYIGKEVSFLRRLVAETLEHNIEEYRPYILLPFGKTIREYIEDIRNTNEWAGDLEITILSKLLDRSIITIGPNGKITNTQVLDEHRNGEPIFVHYNNINHYDGMVLQDGYIGKDILAKLIQQMQYEKRTHIRINTSTPSTPSGNTNKKVELYFINNTEIGVDDNVTNDKVEFIRKFNKCTIS